MSLCQTALWHSKKAACPSPSLSCCPTLPLNLHSGVFHASPGASWLHRSQLSERTEKPCNHGLLAVGSMGPTSIQTLTLLTQHGEKLWMKHLRGCLQIDFFSPLMWICNSGYGEWTQTLFKNCFFGGVYLKQTEVAEKKSVLQWKAWLKHSFLRALPSLWWLQGWTVYLTYVLNESQLFVCGCWGRKKAPFLCLPGL